MLKRMISDVRGDTQDYMDFKIPYHYLCDFVKDSYIYNWSEHNTSTGGKVIDKKHPSPSWGQQHIHIPGAMS